MNGAREQRFGSHAMDPEPASDPGMIEVRGRMWTSIDTHRRASTRIDAHRLASTGIDSHRLAFLLSPS